MAFVRLMAAEVDVLAPVNLGNPAEIPVGELAGIIVDIVGSRSKVVYRPLPMDDPRRRRPNIERAQSALGWSPKVELLTGLRETIAYFDDQLRRNDLRGSTLLGAHPGGLAHAPRSARGRCHESDDRWFGLCRAGRRGMPVRPWP